MGGDSIGREGWEGQTPPNKNSGYGLDWNTGCTMNYRPVTLLCQSKRSRIRNLLSLLIEEGYEIFTFYRFINWWGDLLEVGLEDHSLEDHKGFGGSELTLIIVSLTDLDKASADATNKPSNSHLLWTFRHDLFQFFFCARLDYYPNLCDYRHHQRYRQTDRQR